jgi:hypothetical protein
MPTTESTRSPITPALTSCVLVPSDFCQNVTERAYTRWTPGHLRLAVDALKGAPVAFVADTGTGHTILNVVLTGVRDANLGSGALLAYTHVDKQFNAFGPDSEQFCRVENVGMILPLTDAGDRAKWNATKRQHDEKMAAHSLLREALDGLYGKTTIRCGVRDIVWSWEPLPNAPSGENGKFCHGTIPLTEINEQIEKVAA